MSQPQHYHNDLHRIVQLNLSHGELAQDVNQDKSIGEKEFALLLQNLEFREILSKFGIELRRGTGVNVT